MAKYKGKYPAKFNKFKKLLFKFPTRPPTDIAFEVYNCKDRNVAAAISSQNLRKLNVSIEDLLERAGLTDEYDAKFIKEKCEATRTVAVPIIGGEDDEKEPITVPDNKTQLKAFELSQKMKRRLIPTGQGGDSHTYITIVYGHRNAGTKKPVDNKPLRGRPPRQPVRA